VVKVIDGASVGLIDAIQQRHRHADGEYKGCSYTHFRPWLQSSWTVKDVLGHATTAVVAASTTVTAAAAQTAANAGDHGRV
jgi:hypothetical protein